MVSLRALLSVAGRLGICISSLASLSSLEAQVDWVKDFPATSPPARTAAVMA